MSWKGLIQQYKDYLPVTESTPGLTLLEGNTPLLKCERLSEQLGIELYVKYEGANPTGSFKERGMVMAVAKAKEEGSDAFLRHNMQVVSRATRAIFWSQVLLRSSRTHPHR